MFCAGHHFLFHVRVFSCLTRGVFLSTISTTTKIILLQISDRKKCVAEVFHGAAPTTVAAAIHTEAMARRRTIRGAEAPRTLRRDTFRAADTIRTRGTRPGTMMTATGRSRGRRTTTTTTTTVGTAASMTGSDPDTIRLVAAINTVLCSTHCSPTSCGGDLCNEFLLN